MPNILYYTVACGDHCRSVMNKLNCCVDRQILTEEHFGFTPNVSMFEVFSARSRVREFFNIDEYDGICFIEADVEVNSVEEIGGDKILVERGAVDFSEVPSFHKDHPVPPKEEAPFVTWNGIIYIPKSQYHFIDTWIEYYKDFKKHRNEELVLWNSLQGFDWAFLNKTAFYPEKSDITHYRGPDAKKAIDPDYINIIMDGLSEGQDHFSLTYPHKDLFLNTVDDISSINNTVLEERINMVKHIIHDTKLKVRTGNVQEELSEFLQFKIDVLEYILSCDTIVEIGKLKEYLSEE